MLKYYINNTEYLPLNEGDFSFDIRLVKDAGAYQYVYELNGGIIFDKQAYLYIMLHANTQKILLTISETCEQGTNTIFDTSLYFTHYDCEFMPDHKKVKITPHQDSLYKCLTDSYDIKFNALQVPNVVSSSYSPAPVFIFQVVAALAPTMTIPYFGLFIGVFPGGSSPFLGFFAFAREVKTTYCQGGVPQAPNGTGWQLEINNCAGAGWSRWTRKPQVFISPLLLFTDFETTVAAFPIVPPYPIPAGDWLLMETISNGITNVSFWVNYDSIKGSETEINNGRLLTDVINYGLNISCPQLDLQSQLLFNIVNPVTGTTPSDLQGLQIHSISDVKDPSATEPATREDVTIKDLLEGFVSSKLNAFWRVDERTKRLIIEHYNDLNNQGVIDLTALTGVIFPNNNYSYDNSDLPKAEEFPSLDSSIDFTGVDILFENPVSSGKKAYNTDKFYSEVESILQDPDQYPNDGFVIITPESLAPFVSTDPSGVRAENGAITGTYSPNAPQGMANLHNKYWKFWRPFPQGNMNFINTAFTKNKPVRKAEQITMPLCCFYFFNPYARFVGKDFTNGQLQSASYNPKTKYITLNIQYNE